MSASWLVLVSRDPYFMPPSAQLDAGVSFLRTLLEAAHVPVMPRPALEVLASERPYFHSSLLNFESIHCPGCARALEVSWWQDQLDRDFDGEFIMQFSTFHTPCCNAIVDLNSLVYEMPQAFARFALSCREASVAELTADQVTELRRLLGCDILQVHAHL